jgi:hypothetical protein
MEPFVNLKTITTISDKRIDIPKVSWKTEIRVLKYLSDAVKEVPELASDLTSENPNFLKILPLLLEKVPDTVTAMAAEILKKDNSWIEDELDSERLMDLLFPFFGRFISKLTAAVTKIMAPAAAPVEAPLENKQPKS